MNTRHIRASVTPTIDTNAYSANDVIGGLLSFDVSTSRVNGGIINTALVADDDNEKAALTLYLFHAAPTTIADDAAFAPTIADLKQLCAVIAFSSYTTVNSNAYSLVEDINNAFVSTTGILYGYLVCTATPTYTAATDLTVVLTIITE
jgi:hypothetical protein